MGIRGREFGGLGLRILARALGRLGDVFGWTGTERGFGSKVAQFLAGAIPFPAGGFTAAEDLFQGFGAFAILYECDAEGVPFGVFLLRDQGIENLSFEAAHTPLGPIGGDNLFDEERFLGPDGLVHLVVRVEEVRKLGFVFAGDDEGFGGSAMLQSIEAGNGPAFGGTGASGLLRVETVRDDLSGSGHKTRKAAV